MSTFDGSKVNGLANALQSKMAASVPLNSPEFFDYIQENYPYDFRGCVESLDADYVEEALRTNACRTHVIKIPGYSYNTETKTWSNSTEEIEIPLILCFEGGATNSYVRILFGNYIFKVSVAIEKNAETQTNMLVVGEYHWYKVSLN